MCVQVPVRISMGPLHREYSGEFKIISNLCRTYFSGNKIKKEPINIRKTEYTLDVDNLKLLHVSTFN